MSRNILRFLNLGIIFASLSACTTIHFDNGEIISDPEPYWFDFWAEDKNYTKADGIRYQRWYHQSLYTTAELSNPIQTEVVCQGLEWNRVSAEITPFDLIIGLLDNALFIHASAAAIDLWSPWSVEYSCRTPQ